VTLCGFDGIKSQRIGVCPHSGNGLFPAGMLFFTCAHDFSVHDRQFRPRRLHS